METTLYLNSTNLLSMRRQFYFFPPVGFTDISKSVDRPWVFNPSWKIPAIGNFFNVPRLTYTWLRQVNRNEVMLENADFALCSANHGVIALITVLAHLCFIKIGLVQFVNPQLTVLSAWYCKAIMIYSLLSEVNMHLC